jgi:hypothetical protein
MNLDFAAFNFHGPFKPFGARACIFAAKLNATAPGQHR